MEMSFCENFKTSESCLSDNKSWAVNESSRQCGEDLQDFLILASPVRQSKMWEGCEDK